MNKKFLTMAAFAAMCVFATTSCSNDDDPMGIGTENVENAEVAGEITLALNAGGDGLTTRSARPVTSSAAANKVDEVKLELFTGTGSEGSETWTKVSDVSQIFEFTDAKLSWNGPEGEGIPGTTDREEERTLRLKNLTASTTYKIVAYGYNKTNTGYTFANLSTDPSDIKATLNENADVTDAQSLKDGAGVEEVFMGEATFSTGADKKIENAEKVTVEMRRQVAGMLGYFKNIPVKKADVNGVEKVVKYIRVYANAQTSGFIMDTESTLTGINANGESGKNTKETETLLMEYDLSKMISNYDTQIKGEGKTFTIPAVTTGTVQTVENSLLSGRFILPYGAAVNSNTITLKLIAEDGTTILRTWVVSATGASNSKIYNIERNKFYSIGKKYKSDSTEGPDEEKDDDDDPIDLSTDNEISLILNDAWDVIYEMGLED